MLHSQWNDFLSGRINMSGKAKFYVIAVLIAFGAWFFFTPHLAVRGMRSAIEEKDAVELSNYVDFPALKESLKASLSARLASEVAKEKEGNPFAILGAAMGEAFIKPMIDVLVTPESLAMIMKGINPQPTESTEPSKSSDEDIDTSMSYESCNRFVVMVKKKGPAAEPLVLVFHRDGLFSWKLSALRLPM
jgi:hypothetical protein